MRSKARRIAGRVVNDGEDIKSISGGYMSLKVENENLGTMATNTWVSPNTAVQVGSAKNFEYTGGQILYTGDENVLVSMQSYQALSLAGGNSSEVDGTNGLNNVPDENFDMPGSSAFGGVAVADCQSVFQMSNGDNLNAYVKHTEGVDKDVTLVKGVYHIRVIEIVE